MDDRQFFTSAIGELVNPRSGNLSIGICSTSSSEKDIQEFIIGCTGNSAKSQTIW